MYLKFGSAVAGLSTALLWLASTLTVFLYFGWTGEKYPEYNEKQWSGRLDPRYLRLVWDYRRSVFGYVLSVDFFACCGLLLSIFVIFCLKQILRDSESLLRNVMVYSWLAGCILPALEFLQNMGAYAQSYDFVAEIKFMSEYVALEISYRISQASLVWVFSLLYVLLGVSILCASWMFWKDDEFKSKPHAILGAVLAVVGFLAFIIEISSFFNPEVNGLRVLFGVITLFWGVILLPSWLIFLAVRMGRYVKYIVPAPDREMSPVGDKIEEEDDSVSSSLSI